MIYVFHFNEDGDPPTLNVYTSKAEFLSLLKKDHEGCHYSPGMNAWIAESVAATAR